MNCASSAFRNPSGGVWNVYIFFQGRSQFRVVGVSLHFCLKVSRGTGSLWILEGFLHASSEILDGGLLKGVIRG